ncbi:MAG: SurA N-terminal domain-containing protein [Planctomycetes bacterium]|nr:SurA N-terminal domain-containing protein [Planctomycetota bacterium]
MTVNQVARVGNRIITAEDLIARYYDMDQSRSSETRVLEPQLEYLSGIALLELEADRIGCVISAEELQIEVDSKISGFKSSVHSKYEGGQSWEEWLAQQGMNEASFRRYIEKRVRIVLLKSFVVPYYFEFEGLPAIDEKARFLQWRKRPHLSDGNPATQIPLPDWTFEKWARCVAANGAYASERRLPGLDVEPNK